MPNDRELIEAYCHGDLHMKEVFASFLSWVQDRWMDQFMAEAEEAERFRYDHS
jgi:hypothetical protein